MTIPSTYLGLALLAIGKLVSLESAIIVEPASTAVLDLKWVAGLIRFAQATIQKLSTFSH